MNHQQGEIMEQFHDVDGVLCHAIFRSRPEAPARAGLSAEEEFLQVAVMSGRKGKSFRPHVHLERSVSHENFRAQESWVVMRGKVQATFYSDSGKVIAVAELLAGDVSISFRGGHGYTLLDDSLILEFKTGPYLGLEIDKRFLD